MSGPAADDLGADQAGPGPSAPGDPASGWPLAVSTLLERCTFPPPGRPLVCAVSGGPDSTALLALAVAAGCDVTAVHVDHGLREGSAEEAQVVAAAARRLGASFRAERVEVPRGPNLEARARAARFAVLPPDVATGHTMDDQAETVLANILRGAGPAGVAGMRSGPAHPLLGIRRAEARRVCDALRLEPVADPSNEDPSHLRNRIRHELLPLCAAVTGRDPVPLLARLAAVSAEDVAFLDALAAEAAPDPADAKVLAALPVALARRAVRRWLRGRGATGRSGGRGGAPSDRAAAHHPPSSAEVTRVLRVAGGEAAATELTGGWRVHRSGGRLLLEPARSGAGGPPPVSVGSRRR